MSLATRQFVSPTLRAVLFLASNVVWWRWRFQHTWHSLEYVFGFYLMVVSSGQCTCCLWPSCSMSCPVPLTVNVHAAGIPLLYSNHMLIWSGLAGMAGALRTVHIAGS